MQEHDFQIMLMAFNVVLGIVAFLGGWMLKSLHERMSRMEAADNAMTEELKKLAVAMPTEYIRRNDFDRLTDTITQSLQRIEDKLDKKVDKP